MIFNQILTWLSRTNSTHKKALDCIASSIIAVLLVVSEIRWWVFGRWSLIL